jgi:putative membrane protein
MKIKALATGCAQMMVQFSVGVGVVLWCAGAANAADPPDTATVLGKLHQSDQKEIAAGKLAQKNGTSQQVKDYGKMLEKDHTAADKKVAALAKQEKIDLATATPAGSSHEMSSMASDPMFDTKFAREMVDDHKKDIAEVTQARDATADAKLKKLLTELVPTLQKHEETAQKIVDTDAKK